ncbi:MAG TPA: LuxR C-terminal-related transcriptional regulator [Candidatus Dormibacteraeota bacterium]|nr:LuxR C-terminal-related transcriptional regulator [Candidatus Dormibacteraeota bacterium]
MNSFAVGRHPGVSLTRRQREVAELVVDGLSNKAIAQRLHLSSRTVEEHVGNLFTLFGCNKRTELAARMRAQAAPLERGNLPGEVGDFVGRGAEVGRARTALNGQRLVTLVGEGGSGKTRLALHLGHAVAEDYRDGVWMVELASQTNADLLPQFVAGRLRIAESSSPMAALSRVLGERRLLVVLDNCEHVLRPVAELVHRLLRETRHVRFLATSRERLHVPGERVVRVGPMSPDEATELFLARADVDDLRVAEVARLCERLGRLPLAIELAAARAPAMRPSEIAARLGDRFALLTNGDPQAPVRHRTLEATLDWSYDLLTAGESALFRRLSLFRTGFDLEAVESVCASADVPSDAVAATLVRLVDKSLVAANVTLTPTRYALHEVAREYAAGKLDGSGESPPLVERYVSYYERLVERPPVAELEWMAWLSVEEDNVRSALRLATAADPERGAALAYRLCSWWTGAGRLAEGLHEVEAILRACPAPGRARARALVATARLARVQHGADAALAHTREAVAIAAGLDGGDRDVLAAATLQQAHLTDELGDLDGAGPLYARSLALARELGDPRLTCTVLDAYGRCELRRGDLERAGSLLDDALRVAPGPAARASALQSVGRLHLARGDVEAARAAVASGLSLSAETGRVPLIVHGLEVASCVALAAGWPERALRLCAAASAIRSRVRMASGPWWRWVEDTEREARLRLGAEGAGRAWREGQAAGLPELVELAARP